MQLKGSGCPGTVYDTFGANSLVAQCSTASFVSLSVLSRVPLVSPLKSKPGWDLSLQGWMRRTMKLTATSAPYIFMPFISSRSSYTGSISTLVGFSNQLFWFSKIWSMSHRMVGWLCFM